MSSWLPYVRIHKLQELHGLKNDCRRRAEGAETGLEESTPLLYNPIGLDLDGPWTTP